MDGATKGRGYILFILMLCYVSNYIDRIAFGVLGEPIKHALKLSDTQIGLLNGLAFVVFYAVIGIPIARLADRTSRKNLMAACLGLWSVMTALGGIAGSFLQLMLFRIGVGVGEAGCTPTAHSMIADLYPREERAFAYGLYAAGVPVGILAGTLGGGFIAQELGWRMGLIAVGLPGILLALIILMTVREPQRGRYDPVETRTSGYSTTAAIRIFVKDRLFVHIALAMSAAAIGLYGISTFSVPFLMRAYDLDLLPAASIFGLSWGATGIAGSALGGWITGHLGARDARWYAWLPSMSYIVAAVLLMSAIYQPGYAGYIPFFVTGSLFFNIAMAPSLAVIQNRVPPTLRASASAVVLLMTTVIGLGLGPTLAGIASDAFAALSYHGDFAVACPGGRAVAPADQIACATASFHGLRYSLTIIIAAFFWAAVQYLLAARHARSAPPSLDDDARSAMTPIAHSAL
ncbi:MAG: spinster family MFS transporter [Sphingobium sp.]